jgi:hypothetical protein
MAEGLFADVISVSIVVETNTQNGSKLLWGRKRDVMKDTELDLSRRKLL